MKRVFRLALLGASVLLFVTLPALAQAPVLTQHNDSGRTGQNLDETILSTSNVNVATFGKLFWRTVDGNIFAQPLYVPNLSVGGKTRNVLYVATQHNSVYAFDADDPTQATPLWQVNLGTPVPSQDICILTGDTNPGDCPYLDINPEIGITSTPVIDPVAGIIYVVAKTKRTSDSTYHFSLHALDLKSGSELLGGPTEIAGQVTGGGDGSSGGLLAFAPAYHLQRPSLLLMNGVVYLGFGSVGDIGVYHGWLMGYDAANLQQVSIFCVTPNGSEGGLWAGGGGFIGDAAGYLYAMTANGDFTANTSGNDYGDSFVKMNPSSGLTVADYFTPDNQSDLFTGNVDLGSGGPMAIPGSSLIVGIGKDKIFRVVDTTNMGHFNAGFDADAQEFTAAVSPYFGSPVYWDSPNNGPVVYLWGPNNSLKGYKLVGGQFQTTPVTQSSVQSSSGFSNAVPMSISANGSLLGSGIVWSSASFSGLATGPSVPGIVRAFDATNLTTELWDSRQNAARDDVGLYAKFNPPTVSNGKVYVGTFSGQLVVYGLNPPAASGIHFVQSASATPSTTASVSVPYSGTQTAGDLNVVAVSWNDTTSSIQSLTDSLGNTYSLAIGPTTGTGKRQSIYYAKNIHAGSNTVTVTFNQAASSPDVRVLEYNGVDTVSPLDVSVGASGTSSRADSGAVALTNANDLIIGANIVGAKNTVAGSAFTARVLTSTNSNMVEDRLVNVGGSYDAWTPMVSSAAWVMQMVAFKAGVSVSGNAPTVSGVSPSSGTAAGGTAVTITGSNFTAGASVIFGSSSATNVTVVNSTTITATTPAGAAGTVTVTVTDSNGLSGSLSGAYTYTGGAGGTISFVQVNSATPQSSTASVPVTFPVAQTAGDLNIVAVGWNDATSTVSSVTDSRGNIYTLAVGPTSGTGLRQSIYYAKNIAAGSNTVTVTFSKAAAFPDIRILEYGGLDTLAPLDQSIGAAGSGTSASSGAATTTSANELIFGAGMTTNNTTGPGTGFVSRIITSPDSDIAEDKVVSATGSNTATATVTSSNWVMQMATFVLASAPSPTVTGIGPSTGPSTGGTVVTITGTNFAAGATVSFGANAATSVTVQNSTTISATTPAGVGTVTVTVTNSGGHSGSLSNAFVYTSTNPAPTVSSISPNTGTSAGGTSVTITGTGFLTGATVSLGGTAATSVVVVSATSITANTPAHAAGAVNVVVTNTDAQSATLTNGFTYTSANPAPTVSSISPNTGTASGGTSVTITGTGFLTGATVSLGGTAATSVVVVSATSITAKTPAHAAGAVNVVVTNTDAQSATVTNGFTYTSANPAPTISSISPNTGTASGGTSVTITGTGFLTGATVSLGGTAATSVVVVSATSITAKTPAHVAGAVNVVVTNTDAQSATLTNGFTYTAGTSGPIAFVQVKAATPQTNSSSVAVTYSVAQTLGNLNVVIVGWNDATSTVSSVTDSLGNTYAQAGTTITGTGLRQAIYYAKNIAAGSNTVTVKFSQAAVFVDVRALEYSGLDTTSPFDVSAGAAGTGTAMNSGAATTTSANELIVGAGTTVDAVRSAGTGYTSRIITSPDLDIAEDKTVTATGSYTATATNSSTHSWIMQLATFKAAQ